MKGVEYRLVLQLELAIARVLYNFEKSWFLEADSINLSFKL